MSTTIVANTTDTHRVAVAIKDERGEWFATCEPIIAWNVTVKDSDETVEYVTAVLASGQESEESHRRTANCDACDVWHSECDYALDAVKAAKRR